MVTDSYLVMKKVDLKYQETDQLRKLETRIFFSGLKVACCSCYYYYYYYYSAKYADTNL